jgi:hypothetical protein
MIMLEYLFIISVVIGYLFGLYMETKKVNDKLSTDNYNTFWSDDT